MEKSGPLAGVTVLDLSAVVSGPMAGVLLADQGADVIKVEPVGRGDIQRNVGSRRGGMSGNFHVLNRGKRSLAVDLKHERGRDIVRRLAQDRDAVIQNFRPGVAERLGVGYEHLRKRNPSLVYLSISGFGPEGPHADRRAYDPIIQARSGVAHAQGCQAPAASAAGAAADHGQNHGCPRRSSDHGCARGARSHGSGAAHHPLDARCRGRLSLAGCWR